MKIKSSKRLINGVDSKRKIQGFSMIEMVVSLAVVGFISAAALPSVIAQLVGYDIEKNAKEISTAMMVARVKAIETQMPHRVKVDLNSTPQRFIVQRGVTSRGVTTWVDDVTMSEIKGEVKINRVDDVKGHGKTAGIGSIEFGPMGNPTKGVIYLEDSEGERCTVALNVTTGKVAKMKGW